MALERLGRTDEAIAHYHQALTGNPAFSDAHRNLARLLLSQGQATVAIPHFEAALNASPNDVALRSAFADALARTRQFQRAGAELTQALALLGPGENETAQALRTRLKYYQAGQLEPPKP